MRKPLHIQMGALACGFLFILPTPAKAQLAVAGGGTGATTAANARANLGTAASGVNTDITSITLAGGVVPPLTSQAAVGLPSAVFQSNLNGTIPSTNILGTSLGANFSRGAGETDFINGYWQSTESFRWMQATGASESTLAMSLFPIGRLVINQQNGDKIQLGNSTQIGRGSIFGDTSNYWDDATGRNVTSTSTLVSLSSTGLGGLFGASQTLGNAIPNSQGTIGVVGGALNNATPSSNKPTAYAGYFEAIRSPGAGTTQGVEIDVVNHGNTVPVSPHNMYALDITPVSWLACGGGYSSISPCSAAVGIVPNGQTFDKGIVFGEGSLSGSSTALQMPSPYRIVWTSTSDGAETSSIRSDASHSSMDQIFSNDSVSWQAHLTGVDIAKVTASGIFYSWRMQEALHTPASSTEPCVEGQFSDDVDYHYVCVAVNTWKRVALSSF